MFLFKEKKKWSYLLGIQKKKNKKREISCLQESMKEKQFGYFKPRNFLLWRHMILSLCNQDYSSLYLHFKVKSVIYILCHFLCNSFLKLTLFCLNNFFKVMGDSTDMILLNKAFLKILPSEIHCGMYLFHVHMFYLWLPILDEMSKFQMILSHHITKIAF